MSIFAEGDYIDVVGTSKGKGFQGVVKRHGFAGSSGCNSRSANVFVHRVQSVRFIMAFSVYLKECEWRQNGW